MMYSVTPSAGRQGLALAATAVAVAALAGCGSSHATANGPAACSARDLAASTVDTGAGVTGISHAVVVLMNTGEARCRLSGVPFLRITTHARRTYTPPQVSSGNNDATTLRHGQKASFWIQELAAQGSPVPGARDLTIDLHGVKGAIELPITPSLASQQQLIVSAIAPGVVSTPPSSATTAAPCSVLGLAFRSHFLDAAMPGAYDVEVLTNTRNRPCSVGGVPKEVVPRGVELEVAVLPPSSAAVGSV